MLPSPSDILDELIERIKFYRVQAPGSGSRRQAYTTVEWPVSIQPTRFPLRCWTAVRTAWVFISVQRQCRYNYVSVLMYYIIIMCYKSRLITYYNIITEIINHGWIYLVVWKINRVLYYEKSCACSWDPALSLNYNERPLCLRTRKVVKHTILRRAGNCCALTIDNITHSSHSHIHRSTNALQRAADTTSNGNADHNHTV